MVEVGKKFNKILTTSAVVTISVSLLLAVIVGARAPHVRAVVLPESATQTEMIVNKPAINISFSQPMDRKSVEDAVSVSPEVEYKLNWGLNNLQINFTNNLDLDAEYKISIEQNAKDTFGKNLAENFEYAFHTKSPRFTYLERNGQQQKPDKVIAYDLKSNSKQELYTATGIDYFARNNKYLAVSTLDGAKTSTLSLIEVSSGKSTNISIGDLPFRLTRLIFSPRYDQFIFVAQEVLHVNGVAIPQASSYIFLYDIASSSIKKYEAANVLDIIYSPDGNSLLFRGDEAIYYLMDLQTSELIDLGRHFASGGFSREINRIVFVDYDPMVTSTEYPNINIYNTDREVTAITNGEQFVVDPEFFHRSELILYSEKFRELDGTKGMFSVVVADLQQNKLKNIVKEDRSMELPKLSADDRYILVENYDPFQLQNYNDMRNYVFQTKPYTATLSIYDLIDDKFLDISLSGVDAVWN